MNLKTTQIVAIAFIIILIVNGVLLALGKISEVLFWIIIAVGFGVSYTIKKIKAKETEVTLKKKGSRKK